MPTAARTHKPTHQPDRRVSDRRYNRQHRADGTRDDAFYSTAAWRRFRLWFLARHPLCVDCDRKGWSVAANEVHHKQERRACPERAFDEENCEGLCKACHTRKSNRERGYGGQISRG